MTLADYKSLFEAFPWAVVVSDLKTGAILDCNPAAEELTGISRGDMLKLAAADLFLGDEERDCHGQILDCADAGQSVNRETEILTSAGTRVPVVVNASLARIARRKVAIHLISNVSEGKQAEKQEQSVAKEKAAILDAMPEGVFACDLEGKIFVYNAAAEKIWARDGINAKEFLGRSAFELPTIRQEDVPGIVEVKQEVTESGTHVLIERCTSTERWESISVSPLKDENGNPRALITVVRNITERKRMEERLKESLLEKEILLKELHHRVKNNLQVISSLLKLQSKYIGDEHAIRAFEETQNRVMSMALIHDKLYRSEDLSRIDFADYVRGIVGQIFNSQGESSTRIRTRIETEHVLLGIDAAIPCGLIVNELISNSFKHAFGDRERGEIFVGMRSDKGSSYTLIVSDDGVGFPEDLDFKNTESLGLQLVVALVGQLKGSIELDRSKGTAFKVTFKAPKRKGRGG